MSAQIIAEALQFSANMIKLSYVNIFFCSVAFVATWSFEKQRRFPVSMVGWISLLDIAFNVWQLMTTSSNFPALKNYQTTQPEGFCHLSTTIEVFFAYSALITNTLLSFTIYNLLRRRQDMSVKHAPWFRYAFVTIFWVFSIAFSIGLGLGPVQPTLNFCGPATEAAIIALMVPFLFFVSLQVLFIFMTLYHIQTVTRNVHNQMTDKQRKLRRKDYWMYARFVMIIVVQIVQWFPTYVFWLESVTGNPAPTFQFEILLAYMNQIGFIVESLVIIASNRSLRFWIGEKFFGHSNKSTSDSNDMTKPNSSGGTRATTMQSTNGTNPSTGI